MYKFTLNQKTSTKSRGFTQPVPYSLHLFDRAGSLAEIPFVVDRFRNPEQQVTRAVAVAAMIFELLLNSLDEGAIDRCVEVIGAESVEQLQQFAWAASLSRSDAYVWGRLADTKAYLRHKGQYFEFASLEAGGDIAKHDRSVQRLDMQVVKEIAAV